MNEHGNDTGDHVYEDIVGARPRRGAWGSRIGFILAAAGSAVGLGNIWKFPYITGENGGGMFVLVYLVCIAAVGLPIMIAEVMLGRMTQKSPVGAFGAVAGRYSPWKAVGGLGVLGAFLMLSFYSVVAGWALRYVYHAVVDLSGGAPLTTTEFGTVASDMKISVGCHLLFMALTIFLVLGGIKRGIELASKIMMPLLFVMLIYLLLQAKGQGEGWDKAWEFVFGFTDDDGNLKSIPAKGILEALGHAFFTLSLGMGAMITYGSYLNRDTSAVKSSIAIAGLDTLIALVACMVLFPFTFAAGKGAESGPGLVFISIPEAFSQTEGGQVLAVIFFVLLVFAALTSAISLLEVVTSYFIDQWGMSRRAAALIFGGLIALVGIPSALSNANPDDLSLFNEQFAETKASILGERAGELSKGNWFDAVDYLVSNWMLPLGGMLISIFMAWRVRARVREAEFGDAVGFFYSVWFILLAIIIPVVVLVVMLNAGGVLGETLDFVIDKLTSLRDAVR